MSEVNLYAFRLDMYRAILVVIQWKVVRMACVSLDSLSTEQWNILSYKLAFLFGHNYN